MIQFFIYLLEVSICLIAFYLLYVLLAKNDTYYVLKRYYLLMSIIASLTIPQVPSANWTRDLESKFLPEKKVNQNVLPNQDTFEKIVFGSIPVQFEARPARVRPFVFNLSSLLLTIYLLGLGIMLLRFVKNLLQVKELIKKNKQTSFGKYVLVAVPDHYSTFSFFKYIFFNDKDLKSQEKKNVLLHEEIHIKQSHSIDILFVEICKIIFWFNPIIWMYKNSLVIIHECIADDYILKMENGNIDDYQSLLLKQYLSNINIELAHSFNYSLIKLRIKMMTKKKSKWWVKYKMLFALPVIVISLLAFSNTNINVPKKNNPKKFTEKPPLGMVFIPSGSFTLIRTDGETTKEFKVSTDAFWMKETEVKIQEYNEYLQSVRKDSSKFVYEAALPNYDKAPFKDYFIDQEYNKYPVVGISLRQAQDFCKWKTIQENQKLLSEGLQTALEFRIPDEVEWIYASFGGKNPDEIVKPAKTGLTEIKRSADNIFNGFGLLHMFGNVSEWTNTQYDPVKYMTDLHNSADDNPDMIIIRGENFQNDLINDKLILNSNDSYDYVGFRYVRTYQGKQK